MLTIIYLLNDKQIKYGYLILLALIVLVISYINSYLLGFFIIDVYVLLSITQFKLIKPKYNSDQKGLKIDITTEGIEKDTPDVKTILMDYISKFK